MTAPWHEAQQRRHDTETKPSVGSNLNSVVVHATVSHKPNFLRVILASRQNGYTRDCVCVCPAMFRELAFCEEELTNRLICAHVFVDPDLEGKT